MFAGYLFLRFKDCREIPQINPSQTLMNVQYQVVKTGTDVMRNWHVYVKKAYVLLCLLGLIDSPNLKRNLKIEGSLNAGTTVLKLWLCHSRSDCSMPEWCMTCSSTSSWSSLSSTSSLVSSSTRLPTWEAKNSRRRRSWKTRVSSAVSSVGWCYRAEKWPDSTIAG